MTAPENNEQRFAPEVVFGFVYAVGTQSTPIRTQLEEEIKQFGFEVHQFRLSDYFQGHAERKGFNLPFPKAPYHERVNKLMDAGNKLCETQTDFTARLAVSLIKALRKKEQTKTIAPRGRAYILSSFRRPEEVALLRKIYGPGFYLIGIYGPEHERLMYLRYHENVPEPDARALIDRDQNEKHPSGQKTSDTFALADVYIPQDGNTFREQLRRFVDLVFANPFITPTMDEQSMFMAYSASLRSGDLSRQVGAAVTSPKGDVLGLGCNDVPTAGGGLYWPGPGDQRDHIRGSDSNEKRRDEIIGELVGMLRNDSPVESAEILSALDSLNWGELAEIRAAVTSDQSLLAEFAAILRNTKSVGLEQAKQMLRDTSLFSLTEFGRSVHAEMEALLACARTARSPVGANLHVTTFPCHNCTRHIVSAGVARVVYVEPYPKSLAFRMHWDSITLKEQGAGKDTTREPNGKVLFEPFLGVGPRRYLDLFSLRLGMGFEVRRKQHRAKGEVIAWTRTNAMLRVPLEDESYLERENKTIVSIEP